ncbi:hypothetical protein PMIN01_09735 [Paraphaeosphaeria minitans]|uniref:Uncharacterized protein n=1 Tax=Paraphaeosphaeria minitans TaxID=565426 RepID=A0A9P6GAW4_9PLEO|nr:hypothetical protein PMIN01_09735 [Paraphaeosphaeria minitans]
MQARHSRVGEPSQPSVGPSARAVRCGAVRCGGAATPPSPSPGTRPVSPYATIRFIAFAVRSSRFASGVPHPHPHPHAWNAAEWDGVHDGDGDIWIICLAGDPNPDPDPDPDPVLVSGNETGRDETR